MSQDPPVASTYGTVMLTALVRLHHALQAIRLPLDLPGIDAHREHQHEMVDQLEDYVIPRVTTLEAPLLTVVGGSTGAGKSTLVKLIARYYDVTGGAILVDGQDIRTFDLPSYRRRLGVVPQEPHLFSGTVRDNIAYGRPDAPDAEVEAAARAVGAIDAIGRLPGGFRHPVDERGRNLSAGQRQLLSLARAELVDPDILLLDEATAALDPAAEAAVLTATARVARGRTTVVVAHRLTTAARADQIVVLEHGRVAEVGRHDDLLRAGGAYHRLYAELSEATVASPDPGPDPEADGGAARIPGADEGSVTSIGSAR